MKIILKKIKKQKKTLNKMKPLYQRQEKII